VVDDGAASIIPRMDTISDANYSIGAENNSLLKYSGPLSRFIRYPYDYNVTEESQPNCYQVMKDLAIYFDGFFSIYDGVLRFCCEEACSDITINYHNLKKTGIKALKYDLTNNLHPNFEYYRELLTEYYQNIYGNKYTTYTLKTFDELSLFNTIDGKRVIDITIRKDIKDVTLIEGGE